MCVHMLLEISVLLLNVCMYEGEGREGKGKERRREGRVGREMSNMSEHHAHQWVLWGSQTSQQDAFSTQTRSSSRGGG